MPSDGQRVILQIARGPSVSPRGLLYYTESTSFWIVPQLNAEIFAATLAAFVEEQGFKERKRLLLVLDGAGWHTAGQVRAPPGGAFILLPPYSPELQPGERLWPISNEPLANRAFKSCAG